MTDKLPPSEPAVEQAVEQAMEQATEQAYRVRTSDPEFLAKALPLYRDKQPFELIDDAELGLDRDDLESALHLIRAAKKKAGTPWLRVTQALASLGLCSVGVWMVAAAVVDPDPTSKLGLLIAGGTVIALTGGLGLLASLGLRFSVTAKGRGAEFHIEPKP